MNREEIANAITEGMSIGYKFDTIVMSPKMYEELSDADPLPILPFEVAARVHQRPPTYFGLKLVIDPGCPDDRVHLVQSKSVVISDTPVERYFEWVEDIDHISGWITKTDINPDNNKENR